MWVGTEADNVAALATYASTGADPPEPSVTLTWRFDNSEDRSAESREDRVS